MPKKIRVCRGPHCRFRGAERIMETLGKHFGLAPGGKNEQVDLNFCSCTDSCDFGPNVVEDDTKIYQEAKTRDIIERLKQGAGKTIIPLTTDDLKLDEL